MTCRCAIRRTRQRRLELVPEAATVPLDPAAGAPAADQSADAKCGNSGDPARAAAKLGESAKRKIAPPSR